MQSVRASDPKKPSDLHRERPEVKEWGNLRFDVLENVEVPTEFLLIEVYRPD